VVRLFQAELATREMGALSLIDALEYLELLAELGSARLGRRRFPDTVGPRRKRRR
jgi:hypothetical protein